MSRTTKGPFAGPRSRALGGAPAAGRHGVVGCVEIGPLLRGAPGGGETRPELPGAAGSFLRCLDTCVSAGKRGTQTKTVDGCEIRFAPQKTQVSDDSRVNTNKYGCPMVPEWCEISSIHSMGA